MLKTLPERLIGFAMRHARIVVLLTFVATLVFGWFALKVRVNPDFYSLLPRNAAIIAQLKEYGGSVVPPDIIVVASATGPGGESVYSAPVLAAYAEGVRALGALPEVESTVSPFNLVSFGRIDGHLSVGTMSPGSAAPADVEAFRARLLDAPYAKNLVVSADGTMLISYFMTRNPGSYDAFMAKVNPIVDAMRAGGVTPLVTGTVPTTVQTGFYLTRDLTRLLALAALIVVLCYAAGFRTLRGLFLPLLSVLFGTVWTFGFMGMAGYSLSLISVVAPPLILIFGNEYGIFTMSEYFRSARDGEVAPGWIEKAVRNVTAPVVMAFLTTMVGFLSLCVTDIRQTREFAITASVGSLACAFLALFFLPALASFFHPPVVRMTRSDTHFRAAMGAVGRFTQRFPAVVLGVLALVVVAFALTWPRLSFNTDSGSYYPRNDKVLADTYAIYAKAGGYEQLSISFDAPGAAPGFFLDPAVLAKVEEAERALRDIPDITYSLSLPGLLRAINRAGTGKDELPTNRAVITLFSRLLTSAGGTDSATSLLGNLVSRDFSRLTVSLRMYNSETGRQVDEARIRIILARVQEVLAAHPVGAKVVVWGDLIRILSFADSLRESLFLSLAISVASILLLTALVFRSLLYGLFALVPLGAGLLMNFTMMALTGIPLDMTTIMVSNIAVGVGVDSAIYVVIQYRRELARSPQDPGAASERTVVVMAQPVLLASLSIVAGLLTFFSAAFRPVLYFGALVMFTLVATAAGTLVTLPALLGLNTRLRLARARRRVSA